MFQIETTIVIQKDDGAAIVMASLQRRLLVYRAKQLVAGWPDDDVPAFGFTAQFFAHGNELTLSLKVTGISHEEGAEIMALIHDMAQPMPRMIDDENAKAV